MRRRRYIFELLEPAEAPHRASATLDRALIVLILANVLAVVLESFDAIRSAAPGFFDAFEAASVTVFSLEYVLRLWTADLKYPRKRKITSILRYVVSPMALVDLLAVLPFYLPILIGADLRALRILRVARLLRVMKIHRYTGALSLLQQVLRGKREQLAVTVLVTLLMLLFAASLMYYLETEVQPEAFPNILASLWWAVATLTTVGYGDIYPVTAGGKMLASVIAVLGIGIVALPAGIISSGFLDAMSRGRGRSGSQRRKRQRNSAGAGAESVAAWKGRRKAARNRNTR